MSKIKVNINGQTQTLSKSSANNRVSVANFYVVEQLDCLSGDGETCMPALKYYPVLYLCDVLDEEGTSREAAAVWDEAQNQAFYIALDPMPNAFKMFNYQAHQQLNDWHNDCPLPLPEFVMEEKFNPNSQVNTAIDNGKVWDFINGKLKKKQYFDFGTNKPSPEPELVEEEEAIIEDEPNEEEE